MLLSQFIDIVSVITGVSDIINDNLRIVYFKLVRTRKVI